MAIQTYKKNIFFYYPHNFSILNGHNQAMCAENNQVYIHCKYKFVKLWDVKNVIKKVMTQLETNLF